MRGIVKLFSICFWTGVIMTVISFVLGRLFDFMDIDGSLDFEGEISTMTVSPLKPTVILTFVTVFGGVGIMCMESLGFWRSLFIALFAAFLVSYVIHRWIIVPLYKAQNTSSVSQKELIGHEARATLGMSGENFGKITYFVNGNTYSSPARSVGGLKIDTGEKVVIEKIENNIFWVRSHSDNKKEE